jgi:hypothetical protein
LSGSACCGIRPAEIERTEIVTTIATKTKRLAPTPRIRTKTITAANLLRKISALVLEEPRRVNMRRWISSFAGRKLADALHGKYDGDLPACGTVGCIAGWGAILLRQPHQTPLADTAANRMSDLLAYTNAGDWGSYETVGALFDGDGADIGRTRPGTLCHAKAVARRIDKYIKAHPELETRVIDVARKRVLRSRER